MINKVSQEWEKVERSVARDNKSVASDSTVNPQSEKQVSDVLKHIRTVRALLKRMCQVSVTRTSLNGAVQDAVKKTLASGGLDLQRATDPALSGEVQERLGEMSARIQALHGSLDERVTSVDAFFESVEGRIAGIEGRVDDQGVKLADQSAKQGALDGRLSESFESVGGRIAGIEGRVDDQGVKLADQSAKQGELDGRLSESFEHAAATQNLVREVDQRLNESHARAETTENLLREVDERMERTDQRIGQINGRIGQVEGDVSRLDLRFGELEGSLRKEIEDMVQALLEKFAVVRETLERIEQEMPRKEAVSTANERLQGLQSRFEDMAVKIESIDSVTPEVRGMGPQFDDLRGRIESLAQNLGTADEHLGDLRDEFGRRLGDLSSLLSAGITRWEDDQSVAVERLTAMRDTLRDQLNSVGDQVTEAQQGFFNKLARREGSLKLTREEWDQLAGKMEGIVSGLENVLVQKKNRPS